jgi:hypothetical protein
LNFNCVFILVLMLRHGITLLRQVGGGFFLPLDQHVYLHKVCGVVVVILSALHTLMHIINFREFYSKMRNLLSLIIKCPNYFFIVALNIADELVSPITNKTHSAAGNNRTRTT